MCDVGHLRSALLKAGDIDVPRNDTRAWNFVIGEPGGCELNFHVEVFDEWVDGAYEPSENGNVLPAWAFGGAGEIGGRAVRCITAEYQVGSHTGTRLPLKTSPMVSLSEIDVVLSFFPNRSKTPESRDQAIS